MLLIAPSLVEVNPRSGRTTATLGFRASRGQTPRTSTTADRIRSRQRPPLAQHQAITSGNVSIGSSCPVRRWKRNVSRHPAVRVSAITYAFANLAVISARDDIDSPLPLPSRGSPFAGILRGLRRNNRKESPRKLVLKQVTPIIGRSAEMSEETQIIVANLSNDLAA